MDALFLDFKEWLAGAVEDELRVSMFRDRLNDDVRLWVHPDECGARGEDNNEAVEDKTEGDTDDGAYFAAYNNSRLEGGVQAVL